MHTGPAWGFLHPRGGMVTLAISLAMVNAESWFSTQQDQAQNIRFQLAAAGWIRLVVQSGSMAYLYLASSAA